MRAFSNHDTHISTRCRNRGDRQDTIWKQKSLPAVREHNHSHRVQKVITTEGTALGELEQAIMDLLWDATEPQTANQVRDTLAKRQENTPAITTVLTVLGRLHKKGFVLKDNSHRPHEFSAATSREEHTVQLLNDVLGSAVDKHAVLARFIGGIDPTDARAIQHLLSSRGD